jgi:hypothetical protein
VDRQLRPLYQQALVEAVEALADTVHPHPSQWVVVARVVAAVHPVVPPVRRLLSELVAQAVAAVDGRPDRFRLLHPCPELVPVVVAMAPLVIPMQTTTLAANHR